MINRITAFIFLLLGLGTQSSMGQSLATIEQEAYKQNPMLKALMLEYDAAATKVDQVSVWQGPQISAAVPILPVETRLGAQRLKVGASQMFPWFGVADAKREVFLSMSKERYEVARAKQLEIGYQVEVAYLRLYELGQKQLVLDKKIELFETLERIALSKVESGKANLSDVLRIQLKREELSSTVEIMENKKRSYEAELNKLRGKPIDSPVEITDSFQLAFIELDRTIIMEDIAEGHPSLKQLDWMIQSSGDRIKANDISGKPSFGIGVEYALVSPRTDASPAGNGRDIIIPRISASIPLQRKKYNAQNEEERLRQLALNERKDYIVQSFESQLEQLMSDYRETMIEAELIRKQTELAGSAVEILLAAYSAEGKNIDELLQLENELLALEIAWIEAIVDSHVTKSGIKRIRG